MYKECRVREGGNPGNNAWQQIIHVIDFACLFAGVANSRNHGPLARLRIRYFLENPNSDIMSLIRQVHNQDTDY
jgi:hypothetical protein